MQILIADEQALLRDALRTLVEERGHQVVAEASSALGGRAVRARVTRRTSSCSASRLTAPERSGDTPDRHRASIDGSRRALAGSGGDSSSRRCARGHGVPDHGRGRGDLLRHARAREGRGPGHRAPPRWPRVRREDDLHAGLRGVAAPATSLTVREREVLGHMTRGRTSNRELAETLGVSENTVRFHVRNILEKLHLHTRTAAVAHALTHHMGPRGRADEPGGTGGSGLDLSPSLLPDASPPGPAPARTRPPSSP